MRRGIALADREQIGLLEKPRIRVLIRAGRRADRPEPRRSRAGPARKDPKPGPTGTGAVKRVGRIGAEVAVRIKKSF